MDLEHKAIDRLKAASDMSLAIYQKPLSICYSGGKDSEVLLDLAIKAKIPMVVVNNHTTADAPETVRHIRKAFSRLEEKGIKTLICWQSMERRGKINGKPLYICPICGMATDGRRDNGHDKQLVGVIHPL